MPEHPFYSKDVDGKQFLELCDRKRRGEIIIHTIEVQLPSAKPRIKGLWRVNYMVVEKVLAQPDLGL